VRTNADTPADSEVARKFGAEGIGLCRTEHMFFDPERIDAVREMILAEGREERERALAKILPMQQGDFKEIFRRMKGLPVTIRLLDPPLHEFLPQTVREVEAMLRRLIGENIEILSRLDPAAGTIKADPGQIHQILINLATNARDAMPRGGRLLIETQNVHVAQGSQRSRPEFAPGDYLMLAVSDTGAGMSPATLSRIFEPFFTTKEQGKGTGLGLATVYGIVKQSAGYIYAYSEPGTGTPLKIYLPRESKDARELAGPEAQAKPSAGVGTILVVEDEDAVRELVEIILAKQGYHVLSTSRGREALALCQSRAGGIDLLITDMVMPGMSGRETAEAVRAVMPGIRVLYMTGYTEDFASINGMVSRGEAIMQKPITAADLLERVGALLQAQ